ncbi:unnamed protein product [Mytilus edulis]|uniref:Uncharacterized protein n=1 Tax=Mytilus edulis TaxID=6550 RepID=A0A8S3VCF9_MYTED|nr:unnamed protein product [Mytilus edulis]
MLKRIFEEAALDTLNPISNHGIRTCSRPSTGGKNKSVTKLASSDMSSLSSDSDSEDGLSSWKKRDLEKKKEMERKIKEAEERFVHVTEESSHSVLDKEAQEAEREAERQRRLERVRKHREKEEEKERKKREKYEQKKKDKISFSRSIKGLSTLFPLQHPSISSTLPPVLISSYNYLGLAVDMMYSIVLG